MRSHVLEGRVRHRRARPFVYNLEHGVTYLALDLDELDGIENAAWLIRRNRRGLLEIRDVDHLDPPAEDLERRSTTTSGGRRRPGGLAGHAGHQPPRARVRVQPGVVLPVPRPGGRPADRHRRGAQHARRAAPVHAPPRPGGPFVAAMDKVFYVSPFLETRGGYTVRVRDEPTRLRIAINHEAAEGLLLHTSLDLVRRPLTARSVVRMLVRYPLVTHRTTLMIHWHALRLWLRGARFHRHREAAR